MSELLKSASKIVFIALAATLCLAFLFEVFTRQIVLDADKFVQLTSMAFVFYFASKPSDPTNGSGSVK